MMDLPMHLKRERSNSSSILDSIFAEPEAKRAKPTASTDYFKTLAALEALEAAKDVSETVDKSNYPRTTISGYDVDERPDRDYTRHSAALENMTDAPHPAYSMYDEKTSITASRDEIKVLVQKYIDEEDGLTGLGKVNLESLLTNDEYPCAKQVHELAKLYIRLVEHGVGEETRLKTFKKWFREKNHLPAEFIGDVWESFDGEGPEDDEGRFYNPNVNVKFEAE